jgi:hypothetical protein
MGDDSKGRSKWKVIAEKVAPHGMSAGLEMAAALGAISTLKKALATPPAARSPADLRCG